MKELSRSRYKNLKFIQEHWALSDEELSYIFKVERESVAGWHQVGSISNSTHEPTLLSLMKLYETISEIKKSSEDISKWLVQPIEAFDFKSPLQIMIEDSSKISVLVSYLNPH